MSWETVRLEDLCNLITDGSHFSPQANPGSGFYMASVRDMRQGGFDFANCKEISKDDYSLMRKNGCCPSKGDILIGKDGARFFEDLFVYNQSQAPAILSSIAIVRPNPKVVDTAFLAGYLRQPNVVSDVRLNYGSGSAIPRIVLKDFKRLPILCPPLNIQQRIGSVIASFDSLIACLNRTNGYLAA